MPSLKTVKTFLRDRAAHPLKVESFDGNSADCPACSLDRGVVSQLTWESLQGEQSLYCWRCESVFAVTSDSGVCHAAS